MRRAQLPDVHYARQSDAVGTNHGTKAAFPESNLDTTDDRAAAAAASPSAAYDTYISILRRQLPAEICVLINCFNYALLYAGRTGADQTVRRWTYTPLLTNCCGRIGQELAFIIMPPLP